MPRGLRIVSPNTVSHVVNRGNERRRLFTGAEDYEDFLYLMRRARSRIRTRMLGYVLMPNHWHLILWPSSVVDLSQFMHHLTGAHAARIRYRTGTVGLGHVYQGRYRAFPIESDLRYVRTLRYVEANPLRAGLVDRAEQWAWSSLTERLGDYRLIVDGPVPLPPPETWKALVNDR